MKSFFKPGLLLFVFLTFLSCSEDENFSLNEEASNIEDIINVNLIYQSDGKIEEVTTNFIKNKWENEFLEEGIELDFDKFTIIESKDEETGRIYYFLKAVSKDGTIETGAFLNKVKDDNLFSSNRFEIGSKKCSCTGCPRGCNLHVIGNNCSCTSCMPRAGKCEKKEEIVIESS